MLRSQKYRAHFFSKAMTLHWNKKETCTLYMFLCNKTLLWKYSTIKPLAFAQLLMLPDGNSHRPRQVQVHVQFTRTRGKLQHNVQTSLQRDIHALNPFLGKINWLGRATTVKILVPNWYGVQIRLHPTLTSRNQKYCRK